MSLSLKGQNNLIFEGGGHHGDDVARYSQEQSNAIFGGGSDDGTHRGSYSEDQNNHIFQGGADDGIAHAYFTMAQHGQIFGGASGDGFSQAFADLAQHSQIFNGGSDDGHSQAYFAQLQHNSIFQGGGDDGADNFRVDGLPAIYNPAFAVELLEFDAWPEGDHVQLQWLTASEYNHDYFLVEKSQNLAETEALDRVQGMGGMQTIQSYDMQDKAPFAGRSYYRLQSVDLNGNVEISPWIEVQFETGARISSTVYPNPSSDRIHIKLTGETDASVRLDMIDLMGRETGLADQLNPIRGRSKSSMEVSGLPVGIYILRIMDVYGQILGVHRVQVRR